MTGSDATSGAIPRRAGFGTAVVLLGVAFLAAASAGSLGSVGPYLLGVSVLVAALFVVGFLGEL